jgi:hypothetical protein
VRALIAVVALAACNGTIGTVSVSLITAPGSPVLDNASELRVIVTNPHDVTTVQRSGSGAFDLSLDLPASGDTGALIIDALDNNGDLVATGSSPEFPFGAIDARVVIYMAAPLSIGAAPATLTPARTMLGASALSYGAIFAGGLDATGAPLDAIAVYNAYDHSLLAGKVLPEPRGALTVAVGANNIAYLFGGTDATGNARGNLWRFDTKAAPNGSYEDFGDKAGVARSGALAFSLGSDRFLVSGTPPAELDGLAGTVEPRTEVAALPVAGATVVASDGITTSIFASAAGVTRVRGDTFDVLAIPEAAHDGATLAPLPDGRILVACGAPDAVAIDAATGAAQVLPSFPADARVSGCAIAVTSRRLVIAGGARADTSLVPMAEIFDAATLAPITAIPLIVPRTSSTAIALPNDQVLIAGGTPATETLELFTPDPTE